MIPPRTRALLALVACLALYACKDPAGGLYLEVGAEAGTPAATSLVMRVLVGPAGQEQRFERDFALAGRDLAADPYVVKVTVEGYADGTEARVSLLTMGNGHPTASYAGTHLLSADALAPVLLKAIDHDCDADGDGYKACGQAGDCCTPDEKAVAVDCDDGDPSANPFADTKACRICAADCGQVTGDAVPDVAEPPTDALDVGDASDLSDLSADPTDLDLPEGSDAADTDGVDALDSSDLGAIDAKTEADICFDDCPAKGRTDCVDQDNVRVCDDYDQDGCLEWSEPVSCGAGHACYGRVCLCVADCQGKTCGDDGCGGSCGTCENGKVCSAGACVCPGGAADEDCDGVDDDCDGLTDEDFAGMPTACGQGACARTGLTTCTNGVAGDTCKPGTPGAGDAICNGVDDDCDGQTDEHYVAITSCFMPGACAAGNQASTCLNGLELPCETGTAAASDADCDGVDDDCNGQTDEDYVPSTACFKPGACAAANKASSCTAGVETACKTGTPAASDATCDGVDNDCSGAADEDYAPSLACFKPGACAAANKASNCAAGVETACKTGTEGVETCNDNDDDCDGEADNGGDSLCPLGNSCLGAEGCVPDGPPDLTLSTDAELCGVLEFRKLTIQGGTKVTCATGVIDVKAAEILIDPASSINVSATSSESSGEPYNICSPTCVCNHGYTGASGGGNGTKGGDSLSTSGDARSSEMGGCLGSCVQFACSGRIGGSVRGLSIDLDAPLGGAGGTGCASGSLSCSTPWSGGKGGGSVRLVATTSITVQGKILANGATGANASDNAWIGAGGGAGGSIVLAAPSIAVSGQISASGGKGGKGTKPGSYYNSTYAHGGDGGQGWIKVAHGSTYSKTGTYDGATVVESVLPPPP